MDRGGLQLFALNATRDFGARVASRLGIELSPHEEREFEDGEHKARPLVSVRGHDVFVVQSLYGDREATVNDKLLRLLFFIGALRDASAGRITALVPYLAYARKDAKTKPRDPVTTRYVAGLFEAVGADHVVALETHNVAAFQNAFRIRTDHLDIAALFAHYLARRSSDDARIVVVSPDIGGSKRAERVRQALAGLLRYEPGFAFMEKTRGRGELTLGRLVGDVAGGDVVIVDDLISSGRTLAHAAGACRAAGARRVTGAAAHGLFTANAAEILNAAPFDQIVVTDSVPPFRLPPALAQERLMILSVAPLFAETIRRLHEDGSIADLVEER